MSQTLAESLSQSQSIVQTLVENGGELTPELEKLFDEINITVAAKVDSYAYLMERLDHEETFWRAKAAHFEKVARTCANMVKSIKGRLKLQMETHELARIDGTEVYFNLSKPGKEKMVIDSVLLDDKYKTQVITWVPDEKKITAALADPKAVIKGVTFEKGSRKLQSYPKKKVLNA